MSQSKTTVIEPEENSDAGFVSRWSRLKHEAKHDTENTVTENAKTGHVASDDDGDSIGGLEQKQAASASVLTDADMPDIESMTPDSDYADFLSPGVSEELRKLALRKLFHCEVFNIRDGLDEYDGDYTQFEKLGDIVTSDMQHQIELKAQRELEHKAQLLLQDKNDLSEDGCLDEIEAINDKKASVENNRAAADCAGNTYVQVDELKTRTNVETGEEDRASATLKKVKSDSENNANSNLHVTDEDTEAE